MKRKCRVKTKLKSISKSAVAYAVVLCMLGITGCQKNPEESIVQNKDFDNMIDEAENTEDGSSDVGAMAQEYDSYQTTVEDTSLNVKLNVDAQVDIPKTDKLSVIRVRQKEIDQTFLDSVREALAKDVTFYDGSVLSMRTRSDIEETIQYYQEYKAEYESLYGSDNSDVQIAQARIDELQAEYESAPETYQFADYPTDNQLHGVKEMYDRNPADAYYSWLHELNAAGEVYYGVSDGQDGNYISLYAQNSEDYGNKISYTCGKYDYISCSSVTCDVALPGRYDAEQGTDAAADALEDYVSIEGTPRFEEDTRQTTTISLEEAKQQAESFLAEVGLSGYEYYEGGLDYVYTGNQTDDGTWVLRKAYVFRYLRNIDGVFVNNDAGSKLTDSWSGDDYVKKEWGGESVEFQITDEGIVGFDYLAPIEVVETVVDQSSLKSFDEIKTTFEQMAVVANADEEVPVTIDIDYVRLGYTRISEADSFDTGLLVPVWDFIGTRTQGEYTEENKTILTINAIDGSVIDRAQGY